MDGLEMIENALEAMREERRLDFPATVEIGENVITIDTRITRDPRRSANGGEYSFWLKVWPNEFGEVLVQERCSCDFWQPEGDPEILEGMNWNAVKEMLEAIG